MIRSVSMKEAICALCKSPYSKILFETETEHSKFKILQCKQCDLVSTFPLPDEELLKIHNETHYYGERESKFIPFLQRIRCKLSKIRAGQYLSMVPKSVRRPKILDIGCAEGRLLQSFYEYGCDCFGIEHFSYPVERFVNREKINYLVGDLNSFELDRESFDVIILWHVLEHMDDPDQVMSIIYDILKPNGIFIIAVPNYSSPEARLFQQFWFHLDIPWHKYHFTKRSFRLLIERNHFRVVKSTTFCIEQGIFGIMQSTLNCMGWPRNELYEAMKGSLSKNRGFALFIQSIIFLLILAPCFLAVIFTATDRKGSMLKYILKKEDV